MAGIGRVGRGTRGGGRHDKGGAMEHRQPVPSARAQMLNLGCSLQSAWVKSPDVVRTGVRRNSVFDTGRHMDRIAASCANSAPINRIFSAEFSMLWRIIPKGG